MAKRFESGAQTGAEESVAHENSRTASFVSALTSLGAFSPTYSHFLSGEMELAVDDEERPVSETGSGASQ